MASSICTVVVLPLVPVTASQGAACSGSRSRQASSTSPQTGMPRARGLGEQRRGRRPAGRGDDQVDVVGQHVGRARLEPDVDAEDLQQRRPSRAFSSLVDSSSAVTPAPRCVRLSAAAKPETPKPGDDRADAVPGVAGAAEVVDVEPVGSCSSDAGDPLGVEDAEAGGHAEPGDDPEPDHDGHLLPAEQLEVVLQRRHPEDPVAGLDPEDAAEQPARR